jgi:CheY-like chemotaxis protein
MNPSILVVEDDLDDISFLQYGFREIGFENVAYYNEALSAIRYLNSIEDEHLPNLIVTDYNLPAFNGLELVRFLKQHVRFLNIPLVVFTTSMSARDKEEFLKVGVTDVFIKPPGYDEFKDIVSIFKILAH